MEMTDHELEEYDHWDMQMRDFLVDIDAGVGLKILIYPEGTSDLKIEPVYQSEVNDSYTAYHFLASRHGIGRYLVIIVMRAVVLRRFIMEVHHRMPLE